MGIVLIDTFDDAPVYEETAFTAWDVDADVKSPRISADGDYIDMKPAITDPNDSWTADTEEQLYTEEFETVLKHCLTYAHNYRQLQDHFPDTEEYTVAAPDIQVGITLEDGRPWPYAMTERIRGDQYELYDDDDASQYDPAVDEAYQAMNDVGKKLGKHEQAISYPHELELEDVIVPAADDDPTLYYVNPGSYLPGFTDNQFEKSPHVPDESTLEAWYDPESWPDTGDAYAKRPR